MSTRQYSIFDTIIARISQGSVPFDAVYWIDPQAERTAEAAQSTEGERIRRLQQHFGLKECATCD
ncbi:MAG TPA: hypothetical protein VKB41_02960 [Steroidobacteraceae bacterium]|jgi:hypothetical protein|nr:hypothetical protein [Steroidobacteraceae bacterium]